MNLINNMTTTEEVKIAVLVQKEIIQICNLNKIDYLSLDKNVKDAMIQIFQAGVGFIQKYGNMQ